MSENNDNEMLRIIEPIMHYFCDNLCIMPKKCYDQDKLEEVCADCEIIDVLSAYTLACNQTEKYGEWIPIEERLPEKYQEVIVSFKDECVVAWYSKIRGWINSTTEKKIAAEVTAWMPLPEPYQRDGDAG